MGMGMTWAQAGAALVASCRDNCLGTGEAHRPVRVTVTQEPRHGPDARPSPHTALSQSHNL